MSSVEKYEKYEEIDPSWCRFRVYKQHRYPPAYFVEEYYNPDGEFVGLRELGSYHTDDGSTQQNITLDSMSEESVDGRTMIQRMEETQLEDTVEVESGAEALGSTSTETNPVVASNQTSTNSTASGWPKTSTCLLIGAGLVGASVLGYLVYRRYTK